MTTFVVVQKYPYEGDIVMYAGSDWESCYNFAEKENEKMKDSRGSIVIYTFLNETKQHTFEFD